MIEDFELTRKASITVLIYGEAFGRPLCFFRVGLFGPMINLIEDPIFEELNDMPDFYMPQIGLN